MLLLQQLINGIALGAIYAIFSMGFGLAFSTLGVLNLSQGTIATWGGLVSYYVASVWHTPFPLTLALGCLGAGVLGVLIDQLVFRPLRARSADPLGFIMATIGVQLMLLSLALWVTHAATLSFPEGSIPQTLLRPGDLVIGVVAIVAIGTAVVAAVAIDRLIHRSRAGAAMRAVGWSRESATIVGVNAPLVLAGTFALSAALAGLAGALSATSTGNLSYTFGEGLLLKGFAAVVIGGFGNLRGAAVGGLLIGVSEVLVSQYISSSYRDAITFAIIIAVMLGRPRGFFVLPSASRG
jgi:branched-chain amino acid transport system permease protein